MRIYLDNNATTPPDERVLEAMLPYLKEHFGNPASKAHSFGWEAEAVVDVAREELAVSIGATPDEIIFTSGATESNNLALKGLLQSGDHLIIAATEHSSVLDTAEYLRTQGLEVTVLPVDRYGVVEPEVLRDAITPRTALVSIMLANNETGTLNPVRELAEVAHEYGVPFHTDATQALGKVPLDVEELGVNLMSLSAHKCYGPKGVGALYVRRRSRLRLQPILHGGGHERGLRSGTLNVPGIAGFGRAAAIAVESLSYEAARINKLREDLWERLRTGIPGSILNGHPEDRLPNTLNITIPGLAVEELLSVLMDVALSTGSACASGRVEPSHVLAAMGLSEELASSSIRISLGRFTTEEEVKEAAARIVRAVNEVRRLTPGQAQSG